jgi:5'-methylthioadenosine phosphorylase
VTVTKALGYKRPMSVAVILGSAFEQPTLGDQALEPRQVDTRFGAALLHRYRRQDGQDAWVSFRHGVPHRYLPTQINYRAQAAALQEVGCGALLATSSVGVLDPTLPLDAPLLVSDLLMPDNRLPDGSACSMFPSPEPGQWHLVLDEGIVSAALNAQVAAICDSAGIPVAGDALFLYAMGPRTKTAAENTLWARLGAQVNSMTVGPELVLAAEQGMPAAGLVVGHKYSRPGVRDRLDRETMVDTLLTGRQLMGALAVAFLEGAAAVPFKNRFYRYPS